MTENFGNINDHTCDLSPTDVHDDSDPTIVQVECAICHRIGWIRGEALTRELKEQIEMLGEVSPAPADAREMDEPRISAAARAEIENVYDRDEEEGAFWRALQRAFAAGRAARLMEEAGRDPAAKSPTKEEK